MIQKSKVVKESDNHNSGENPRKKKNIESIEIKNLNEVSKSVGLKGDNIISILNEIKKNQSDLLLRINNLKNQISDSDNEMSTAKKTQKKSLNNLDKISSNKIRKQSKDYKIEIVNTLNEKINKIIMKKHKKIKYYISTELSKLKLEIIN